MDYKNIRQPRFEEPHHLLAYAVIKQAANVLLNKSYPQKEKVQAYLFLIGESEMSSFWFDAVNLPFLEGTRKQVTSKLIKNKKILDSHVEMMTRHNRYMARRRKGLVGVKDERRQKRNG